jgi:hypothetical protein
MGSHGGATAEGQLQILRDYGITEEAMGCPVKSSMETVEIGLSAVRRQPVRIDKYASEAVGILLFNRVKPHTSFRGRYESGLMKMMAIGLGKQHGAENIHHQSPGIMHELGEEYGRAVMENCPILGGIALWKTPTMRPIWSRPQSGGVITEEPKLRDLSYETIARLLFDECDVLVWTRSERTSRRRMDPNISGTLVQPQYCPAALTPRSVHSDLVTRPTAMPGIGLAEVTTRGCSQD